MVQPSNIDAKPFGRGPHPATLDVAGPKRGQFALIVHNDEASLYATAPSPTDQDIHDRILDAILARRLRPGVRLVEEELARLFGVSRTKVRHALARLTQDGIVHVRRNHGATVAAPTRAEAAQVFEFRRMVEPALSAALANCCPPGGIEALRRHIAREHAARSARDDTLLVRLTGEFHLLLAGLHGNALLVRSLREAEALTCLCIISYGRPNAAACLPDEHEQILAAIEAGDTTRSAELMRHHLEHVAAELDLAEPAPAGLAAVLALDRDAA